ncbi:phage baseplate protein [Cupriavidus respiraculi]|uniref:Dit-like phage tail protein N-terminal domain-containing protein n=1 Tax=Cupriavidus respiraculi TaxID=195930 RepID=A0ABN7YI11_9BURK|nr:hypothetical protein [Cupriavidus respiraculi]CAG9173060.1 hypothetical protein LMG21510_02146 [Cupriavidus respiraculi]
MSTVSLVFEDGVAQTSVGAIMLDALLDENTELASRATEYAVEEGSPITDHVVLESERLDLSGWITGAGTLLFGAGGRSKLISAKDALRAIHAARSTLTVMTGIDMYVDMVMETCKISRDGKGEFFHIAAGFRKIRKATLRTVAIPPDKVRAGKAKQKAGATKTNAGKVTPKDATPRQRSDLKRIFG